MELTMAEQLYVRPPRSFNNRLLVEVYKKEALKTEVKHGFAIVEQKVSLKGLKVLADAQLNDGTLIKKGSIAYIKEEELHTKPWAQKVLKCSAINEPFFIIDLNFVELIESPSGE